MKKLTISPIFSSLRPKQWTKNLILFAGLLFSEQRLLFNLDAWLYGFAGFFIFCGLSGSVYIMNDITDIRKDRLHPQKCNRPIASGELPLTEAKAVLIIVLIFSLVAAWNLSELFFTTALAYFMLNLAYSFKLKNLVILDVMSIAIGFVFRAIAGVGLLKPIDSQIYISHWLILSTLMLSMFLGLAKRRQEIASLSENANQHRKILSDYSPAYIDQMTSILAATAIITYSFYTVSPETIQKFGTDLLILSVPMVIYGILRYLYLIHIKNLGDNPADVLLQDFPLQLNLLIWIMVIIAVIHLPGTGLI
ncbi:MAG: decaprenyl-phosphate phosphoribosyltransferase [Candidatus Rifleibacteriota bacterium]